MSKKTKNPLYVVKGDQVEPADGIIDFISKKLNLEPFIEFMNMIFNMMLNYATNFTTFMIIKNLFDDFMRKVEMGSLTKKVVD